ETSTQVETFWHWDNNAWPRPRSSRIYAGELSLKTSSQKGTRMLLVELRAEVARYARKMATSGLVRATQGNLSARDAGPGRVCIPPGGADYETLTGEDIIVVDEEGHVVQGQWRPSLETPLHTLILRRRRDISCVMHTHSPYATACGVVYQPVPVVLSESA